MAVIKTDFLASLSEAGSDYLERAVALRHGHEVPTPQSFEPGEAQPYSCHTSLCAHCPLEQCIIAHPDLKFCLNKYCEPEHRWRNGKCDICGIRVGTPMIPNDATMAMLRHIKAAHQHEPPRKFHLDEIEWDEVEMGESEPLLWYGLDDWLCQKQLYKTCELGHTALELSREPEELADRVQRTIEELFKSLCEDIAAMAQLDFLRWATSIGHMPFEFRLQTDRNIYMSAWDISLLIRPASGRVIKERM